MENASKALVIAGAILISILIIGLGVFIYNGAAGTVKKANLNSQEAQAQNNQFEAYFGTHVSATEVKQLLSLVRSNNITSETNDEDKKIYINSKDSTVAGTSGIGVDIKTGTYYVVEVMNDKAAKPGTEISDANPMGYWTNGYIRNISIQPAETGSSDTTTTTTTTTTPTT